MFRLQPIVWYKIKLLRIYSKCFVPGKSSRNLYYSVAVSVQAFHPRMGSREPTAHLGFPGQVLCPITHIAPKDSPRRSWQSLVDGSFRVIWFYTCGNTLTLDLLITTLIHRRYLVNNQPGSSAKSLSWPAIVWLVCSPATIRWLTLVPTTRMSSRHHSSYY